MITKKNLPLLIALIFCLEGIIYLWATWTTDAEFIFDKCARNSGRLSSALILIVLIMIGYYGLNRIYLDEKKTDAFRVLLTLFSINHLIHFFYVFLNFKSHSLALNITEHKHGFITFLFILIFPLIIWLVKNLIKLLYSAIILYVFNVSYFINETFLSKVKPDKPAYHNQFGIVIITAAILYVLYRIYQEHKPRPASAN